MDMLSIIVDNRERNYNLLEQLSKYNIKLSFKQLPIGDYIVSDRMCIERKTINDFENSIIDSRIFDQSERLSKSFEKPIIIIEGDISHSRLDRNIILGTIFALYREYNIQIMNSLDTNETSYLLSKFAEKEQINEKHTPKLIGIKKSHSEYDRQIMLLSTLPGIGSKLAVKLINKFGSIKNISNATEEDLCSVEKIGKRKANKIYEIFNLVKK